MTASVWVALWLLVNLFAVGLWDVFSFWWYGGSSTVSAVIWAWSLQCPALPLFAGLLGGHLFLGHHADRPS